MRIGLFHYFPLILLTLTLFLPGYIFSQEEEEEEKRKDIPKQSSSNALKIIKLHNKAIGGEANIDEIKTLIIRARIKEGSKFYDMTYYYKAPNLYREEKSYKHLGRQYIFAKAFDGETGWNQELSPEKKDANLIKDKKQLGNLGRIAEMGNPLMNSDEKKHIFVYAGKEVVLEKFPTYKIKGYLTDGLEETYFIDMKNFVLRRVTYTDVFAGKSVSTDYYIVKYQTIANVVFPEKIEYVVGQRVFKTVEYTDIEVNKSLEDSFFQMPLVKEYWLRQRSKD